jgi:putative phosphoribosyl transferase
MVVDAVRIADGADILDADLHLPENARGLVIFAHGSGSSRFSSRNRQVAESLNNGHVATLLLDLLTPAEERIDVRTAEYRFDIPLLGRRVIAASDWASGHPTIGKLPIAAAERPNAAAVVSRGGRPDLAADALPAVRTPTLLIVGGNDGPVIQMNEAAMRRMHAPVELAIVPQATHLFEERGALEEVQRLALDWFTRHMTG